MLSENFSKVCRVEDLTEGIGKRFLVNEIDIALFKIKGEVFALSNVCPHQHSALIYEGFIEDNCVVCPAHGWKFKLKDGKMENGGNGLNSYPVKVIDDIIYIKAEDKSNNW